MYMVLGRKGWRRLLTLALCGGLALFMGIHSLMGEKAVATAGSSHHSLPIYSVDREEKVVALGFNVAWGDEDVQKILDILKEEEVKATFFVVGDFARKFPAATRMFYDAGHEVQSHSDKHKDMTKLSREEIIADVRSCENQISQITGVRPHLFRAPSGAYNDRLVEVLTELGYTCIQWDADSIDWKNPTPNDMCNRIIRKVRPGSITLFHVGAKNTPEALPLIIKELKLQGYRFVTVSDLLYKDNYTIDFQGRQISSAKTPGESTGT